MSKEIWHGLYSTLRNPQEPSLPDSPVGLPGNFSNYREKVKTRRKSLTEPLSPVFFEILSCKQVQGHQSQAWGKYDYFNQ